MKQYRVMKGTRIPKALHSVNCKCDSCFKRLQRANKASKEGGGSLRQKMMLETKKRIDGNV